MEEGRLVVAMGRVATAKLTFDPDKHGDSANFRTSSASEPIWGSEATAIIEQWRFPAQRYAIPITVLCTVELVSGERVRPGI